MKHIFSILLCVCLMLCGMTAYAAEATPGVTDSGTAETLGASETAPLATPTSVEDHEQPEELPESCETGGMTLMSGWGDEGNEFFTRIRLTATDSGGNPIAGAVYGLYRTSDNGLVEYLTTDGYGVAVSGDVPVDTDYYLLEVTTPTGYQPNSDRKDIVLTEICAPSRMDVTAQYDPIVGRIKVIKTDENGNPLSGVGFYVYDTSSWSIADDITTDANGEAITGDLPYGEYALYEYDPPEGYSGGGYTYVSISSHEETVEISITNCLARGYAGVHKTGNDGRTVQGAVFSVYRIGEGDEWIEDITTGSSGYAYTSYLTLGEYYLLEKSVPAPYEADTETKHYFTISYDGQSVSLNVENPVAGESGRLKIIKTDDAENPLDGVVFGLYRAWDSKKLGELTTGADGTVTSGDLIPGDYYIVELSGKTGYTMHSGQIAFTVDGSGGTVELTVENPKIRIFGKVKAIKADDAGNPLSGVRFGVYCHADNLLEEIVTGADGTAISGVLNEGDYYIKELEGLPGYMSDSDTKHPFSVTENGVIISVNITNPRISGAVKVIKTGQDEETLLAGVVFGVYRAGTEDKVCELTTGADGTAVSGTLYYGDYELRELATLDGYELIDTAIPFAISENDVTIEIPVSNPLIFGSVRILKFDGQYQIPLLAVPSQSALSPLAGATFGIYNSGGQKIGEVTTDADGLAVRGGLPKGDYYLKELVAPEGFILPDDMIPFSIQEQGYEAYVIVSNTKGYGTLKLVKFGEDEAFLPGVVFEVFKEASNAKVGEITTDANGIATLELPLGRYYLKEKSTVTGYKLLSGSVSFALTVDGATVELSVQNQKEPTPDPEPTDGKIKLIKKSDTGAKLKGAVFGVYEASNDVKVCELTTDTDGKAVSPELPIGDYYLKEIKAPSGFKLSADKIAVTVRADKTAEVAVINYPEDTPTPDPEPKDGKIRLIKRDADSGNRLKGAVFGVYKASNDVKVCELTTDADGEAVSPALPIGDYYLKEIKAPAGFKLNAEKIGVTVKADKTVDVTVTNEKTPEPTPTPKPDPTPTPTPKPTPDQKPDPTPTPKPTPVPDTSKGELLILKKAAQSGNPLSGALFGVYQSSDGKKVAELTAGADGKAKLQLTPGEYFLKELKSPYGYLPEDARIKFIVVKGAVVTVEVTNLRDETIPDADIPAGGITVPKTGEDFPYANYIFGAILLAAALMAAVLLFRKRRLA